MYSPNMIYDTYFIYCPLLRSASVGVEDPIWTSNMLGAALASTLHAHREEFMIDLLTPHNRDIKENSGKMCYSESPGNNLYYSNIDNRMR